VGITGPHGGIVRRGGHRTVVPIAAGCRKITRVSTNDALDTRRRPGSAPVQGGAPALVPAWALAISAVLLVLFVALSVEAYAGDGLRNRLLDLVRGGGTPTDWVPPRAYYVPGSSVRVGQKGWGSEGQDRVFLEGDVVLLGDTRQLVQLVAGGRTAELRVPNGASTTLANLGTWDATADRLSGVAATFQGGQWTLPQSMLKSVGAVLHPARAPSEALTDGFTLGPNDDAGRVRRLTGRDAATIRIRANIKTPAFTLDSRQPLPTLDRTLVSVRAVVRAEPGSTLMLAINDVVNAAGQTETVVERQQAGDEWLTLIVRRRMVYPSPADGYTVGLVNAEAAAWFEVQSLDVFTGVAP